MLSYIKVTMSVCPFVCPCGQCLENSSSHCRVLGGGGRESPVKHGAGGPARAGEGGRVGKDRAGGPERATGRGGGQHGRGGARAGKDRAGGGTGSVCVDKNWAVPGRFFQSLPVPCGAGDKQGRGKAGRPG
jgi:hypothetical protein